MSRVRLDLLRASIVGVRAALAGLVTSLDAVISAIDLGDDPPVLRQSNGLSKAQSGPSMDGPSGSPDSPLDGSSPLSSSDRSEREDEELGAGSYLGPARGFGQSNGQSNGQGPQSGQSIGLPDGLRRDMAGVWDGNGGLNISGTNRARIAGAAPVLVSIAARYGRDPVDVFREAAARFKADRNVQQKRFGLPVFLSQLEQWCAPDPEPQRTPGEVRAAQSVGELARMEREQAEADADPISPEELRELTALPGRRVAL